MENSSEEWSFLDSAIDWEDLLQEPLLPTLMDETPLDLRTLSNEHANQVVHHRAVMHLCSNLAQLARAK